MWDYEFKLPYYYDKASVEMLIKEVCQENVYMVSPDILSAGDVVIDLGANIGVFSLFVLALQSQLRVIAVEPDYHNLVMLQQNISANNRNGSIVVEPNPIKGSKELYFQSGEKTGVHITKDCAGIPVISVTMEELFDKYNVQTCRFLKVDIEGSEYDVLLNCEEKMLRQIDYMGIEFHNTENSEELYLQLLDKLKLTHNFEVVGGIGNGLTGGNLYVWRKGLRYQRDYLINEDCLSEKLSFDHEEHYLLKK